jgi:glutamine cyclotransferase
MGLQDHRRRIYRTTGASRLVLSCALVVAASSATSSQAQDEGKTESSQHPYFLQMAKRVYADTASTPVFTYRVVNSFPHDPTAFTQGLAFDNGFLYEGTGLRGSSSVREVELETGSIVRIRGLDARYFGEGITVHNDRIFQLTWTANRGFIYDRTSLNIINEFRYPFEGWGATHNGQHLMISDGSSRLYFLELSDFTSNHSLEVTDSRGPLFGLNELEFVRGEVFANVWPTDFIARIDPSSGKVVGWIDLRGLLSTEAPGNHRVDVLNGTAYDEYGDRLFVTGKCWPRLFEIELVEIGVRP